MLKELIEIVKSWGQDSPEGFGAVGQGVFLLLLFAGGFLTVGTSVWVICQCVIAVYKISYGSL